MNIRPALAGLVLSVLLTPVAMAQSTNYPMTIENCGRMLRLDAAPQKVVSLGQAMHEILYALDLGDRMVGTAVWLGPVKEQYAAANAAVPRIADEAPSFESVISSKPTLVLSEFEWHVGPQGAVGTREQFADVGIQTYIAPMDCTRKDNSSGGNGRRVEPFTMDQVYQAITELSQIFDVQDRGKALVTGLREREALAVASVAKARDIPVLVWFTSPEMDMDASVAGTNGAPQYILSKLNARNVVTSDEEWPWVGWEVLAKSNPAVIVLAGMDRRFNVGDDPQKKIDFLTSDPVTSQMSAVKARQYFVMRAESMNPSMRTVDGIELLAEKMLDYGLAE
ncbi:ABC transporter substrate-binding protein [Aquamicrobium sp. LC103]|uniref:ABC transporter substrate-binding protein n=1 Tax=Aquamicrobium sp. LC103 TaxID=1120658 RepID=UPI00069AE4C0|nr:ABC transporter substrate-binding protein [Aquamicrobium sp. LC103]TKT74358.1 ABC transporter substrate-binding protein [Aquamicrobium sp. LC103]